MNEDLVRMPQHLRLLANATAGAAMLARIVIVFNLALALNQNRWFSLTLYPIFIVLPLSFRELAAAVKLNHGNLEKVNTILHTARESRRGWGWLGVFLLVAQLASYKPSPINLAILSVLAVGVFPLFDREPCKPESRRLTNELIFALVLMIAYICVGVVAFKSTWNSSYVEWNRYRF
jgi:hypothetical protein